jgi:serine/threonine protein kinase/Flp pilus assembly protein TadD
VSFPNETLLAAARQVADRAAVDWSSAEAGSSEESVAALRELRRVQQIAELHERASPFDPDAPTLERPPARPGSEKLPLPWRWSGLELREAIGSGGFGNVYRAWDAALEREVALKLVPVPADDRDTGASVLAEGRRLARVRHPNVMAVYGAERVEDKVGIWGELIRGRTLAAIVAEDGPMGAQEAALIGVTLCQALAAVHAAGLLHRDVKAHNVIREQGGRIVLVDLGAGRAQQTDSPEHDLRGTPLYMAPELFSGASASPSSDRYSLGVLLFYLVSGTYPIPGRTAVEVAEAVARGQRRSLRDVRPDLPEAFVRVVERALSAEPEKRHGSDGELEGDLARAIGADAQTPRAATTPAWGSAAPGRRLAGRLVRVLPAAVLLIPAAVLVAVLASRRGPDSRPALSPSIALTSIRSLSADPADDLLAAGITTVLESNLGSIPGLLILAVDASEDDTRGLGVSYELRGTVQRSGEDVRATLRLLESATGALAWSRSFDGKAAGAFDFQVRILDELVRGLRALDVIDDAQITAMRERLEANPTEDPVAFTAYARSRTLLEQGSQPGNLEQGIAALEDAVARDPAFALAHAALGEAYWEMYERTLDEAWTAKANEHGMKALELAPEVPRVRRSLALILHGSGRSREAVLELERTLELQPASDAAYRLLGRIHGDLGETEAAERAFRKAIELRPGFAGSYAALGSFYFFNQRYDHAIEAFRQEVGLMPDSASALQRLATGYHAAGDLVRAESHYRRSIEIAATATAWSNLGTIYFGDGRLREAAEAYERSAELAPNQPVTQRNLGDAYRRLGEDAAAERAYSAAIESARRALQVDPSDARMLALQALCESKLGRHEEALALLARAEQLRADNGEILYKKAAVLALAGRAEEALATLTRALDAGYTKELLANDEDFASLRDLPGFASLLAP